MRTRALIIRICQQMLRDKRTLGLLFFAPLFVLTLVYFLFKGSTTVELKLGTVNVDKSLVQILEKTEITIKEYNISADDAIIKDAVITDNLDGLLLSDGGEYSLTLQNSDPSRSKALQMKLSQSISAQIQATVIKMQAALETAQALPGKAKAGSDKVPAAGKNSSAALSMPSIDFKYVYGNSDTSFFDVFSPIFIGFFVFFFVFLISGIGLLRERMTGTLERLMSTPIRRSEVITGYLAGFGLFAVIQTLIVVEYSINILDITIKGSIWNVLLINLLMAFTALSLGILLSTFATSEFQMIQFIPVVIIPQIFFSGIIPVESMAGWLQVIAKILPIYYGADALKGIMYKGLGLSGIGRDVLALVLFSVVFITLNIFALKKYRKI